ncbi:MAG: 30S ribosomal protein S9 [Candidatus Sungbacteria bacterium]|nr:30S ribosomal protein S9 [Candidatus Sungbacteria bacterium]
MPAEKKPARGAARAKKEEKPKKAKKEEPAVESPAVVAPSPVKTEESEAELHFEIPKTDRYFEAVGRRKTAIARVRLFTKGDMGVLVNDRPFETYFPTMELQKIVEDPLKRMKSEGRFRVSIRVKGGGVHAQAEAVRMGIARALTIFNPEFRKRLKKAGFLTRDSRMVERKKFGLKKARRAPQWQKR